MDFDVKAQFADDSKKQISKFCTFACFGGEQERCLEGCYESYLKAFNSAAKMLKVEGHKRNSRYVHLAYGPNVDEYKQAEMFSDFKPDMAGYVFQYDEFDIYETRRNS